MFKKIARFFQHVYFRSTYRQRFIFFSMLFLCLTPLPDIWLQKIQNYLIARKESQLIGLRYEKLLGNLVYQVALHQHYAVYTTYDKVIQHETLKQIEETITEQFARLKELNTQYDIPDTKSLGMGFSDLKTEEPNLDKSLLLWDKILRSSHETDKAAYMNLHDDLVERLRNLLAELGYSYNLALNDHELGNALAKLNLVTIPFLQDRMIDIYDIDKKGNTKDSQVSYFIVMDALQQAAKQAEKLMTEISELADSQEMFYSHNAPALRALIFNTQDKLSAFLAEMSNSGSNYEIVNQSMVNALEALNALEKGGVEYSEKIMKQELNSYNFQKYSTIFLIYVGAVNIMFFILFQGMTAHMNALKDHINQMSRGHFTRCFCSEQSDEFGPIGIAFDKMGQSVQGVVQELTNLGKQLTDSISQISTTAKEEEDVVAAQEKGIQEIELTAQEIALQSRDLANMMNNISQTSKEYAAIDTTKTNLDHMQGQMLDLSGVSTRILQDINVLHEKINGTETLMLFMRRVSDQARLLSLNSAIETANVYQQKQSFAKITQEIQRFAEKTTQSIDEIQKIIDEISFNVAAVRVESNICVNEIKEGVNRLISVNQQLTLITNQGKDQVKKFDTVNDVMQVQAFAAENIIESISKISENAGKNTKSIRSLHHTTEELHSTAKELQRVTGLFFKKEES